MIARGTHRRRSALSLVLASAVTVCAAAGGPAALAAGESGAAETGAAGCPSHNPPNQLSLVAGTPQTTGLDAPFASGLQVALTNSDGCAVTGAAGVQVTFSAPAAGPSGRFSASNSNIATVGADASGSAVAPTLTADGTAGSFTVTAASQYGTVSFSLTNTAAGLPARLGAVRLEHSSATIGDRFADPLQVRVLDAAGNPVAGASVTFTLVPGTPGTCAGSAAAGASFAGGGAQATVTSDSNGLATSPAFTAGDASGSFSAVAAVSSGGGGAEDAAKSGAPAITPVSFRLADLAGPPAKLVPGVGATQSAPAGSAFAVRFAVTVTDSDKNPVPEAMVTFVAPASGASGHFTIRGRASRRGRPRTTHPRRVTVRTGACGVAVAPSFSAGLDPGGYIVRAVAPHARPVAFALVNEVLGQGP